MEGKSKIFPFRIHLYRSAPTTARRPDADESRWLRSSLESLSIYLSHLKLAKELKTKRKMKRSPKEPFVTIWFFKAYAG